MSESGPLVRVGAVDCGTNSIRLLVADVDRTTAGGMPDRVKCLHALAGHALAAGPGVNPIGDRAVEGMGEWWAAGPCVPVEEGT